MQQYYQDLIDWWDLLEAMAHSSKPERLTHQQIAAQLSVVFQELDRLEVLCKL